MIAGRRKTSEAGLPASCSPLVSLRVWKQDESRENGSRGKGWGKGWRGRIGEGSREESGEERAGEGRAGKRGQVRETGKKWKGRAKEVWRGQGGRQGGQGSCFRTGDSRHRHRWLSRGGFEHLGKMEARVEAESGSVIYSALKCLGTGVQRAGSWVQHLQLRCTGVTQEEVVRPENGCKGPVWGDLIFQAE